MKRDTKRKTQKERDRQREIVRLIHSYFFTYISKYRQNEIDRRAETCKRRFFNLTRIVSFEYKIFWFRVEGQVLRIWFRLCSILSHAIYDLIDYRFHIFLLQTLQILALRHVESFDVHQITTSKYNLIKFETIDLSSIYHLIWLVFNMNQFHKPKFERTIFQHFQFSIRTLMTSAQHRQISTLILIMRKISKIQRHILFKFSRDTRVFKAARLNVSFCNM